MDDLIVVILGHPELLLGYVGHHLTTPRPVRPGDIKALGESIYQEHIQARIGLVRDGEFVVVDIESGYYEIDASDPATVDPQTFVPQHMVCASDITPYPSRWTVRP